MTAPRPTLRQRAAAAVAAFASGKGKPPTDQMGRGPRSTWYGEVMGSETDHVAAWQLPQRWTTIRSMLTDPDVAATVAALTLPLRSTTMTVEPGSRDPLDVDVAAGIERDLNNMTSTLEAHRAEVLDSLAWGTAPFETVYDRSRDDGRWHLRKLVSLPPSTIDRWLVDDLGGPAGIVQAAAPGTFKPGEPLGMERLVVFVHDRRGGDLTGTSVLRPAYGPWLLKTELAKTGAIAAYRNGVGIPWMLYKGNDDHTASSYHQMLMGLHGHAKAFMFLTDIEDPSHWGIKGVDGTLIDPVPQLEYHRRGVYGATLTQFLLLGSGDVGSFALSADHSSFLLLALQAVQAEILGVYNAHLIPRLVGFNYGDTIPADRMPRVVFGRLDRHDLVTWFGALKAATEAGVALDRDAVVEKAHERLGVPIPEADDDRAGVAVADANNPADEDSAAAGGEADDDGGPTFARRGGQAARRPVRAVRRAPARALAAPASGERLESVVKLEALGISPSFATMASSMDDGVDGVRRRLRPLQDKAAAFVTRRVREAVRKGDPDALAALELGTDREAAELAAAIATLYATGRREVKRELIQQGAEPDDPDADADAADDAAIEALGAAYAGMLGDRMLAAARTAGASQIARGIDDEGALREAVTSAPDSLLTSLGAMAVALGLAMGRQAMIDANAAAIGYLLYTAVMDPLTCPPCGNLDGNTYRADDPAAPRVPLPECRGRDRCRCILVPVVQGGGRR